MYYEKLAPYMQDIYSITAKAVKGDEEPVALQAIEFVMRRLIFWKNMLEATSSQGLENLPNMSSCSNALGPDFAKYMLEFYKFLEMDLQNFEEYQFQSMAKGTDSGEFVVHSNSLEGVRVCHEGPIQNLRPFSKPNSCKAKIAPSPHFNQPVLANTRGNQGTFFFFFLSD
ncbi:hypothetical protein VNO78_06326 [Psophocarpus tetragonolobus]|uniref:Uncharacterized protein n=1 Tax=Psophocarpus tetragonolobus TaxID=3891 RepID=A0AAN9XRG7_PSOTE